MIIDFFFFTDCLVCPRPRGQAWQVAHSLEMRPYATCPRGRGRTISAILFLENYSYQVARGSFLSRVSTVVRRCCVSSGFIKYA